MPRSIWSPFGAACLSILLATVWLTHPALGADAVPSDAEVHAVEATFNDAPFEYQMSLRARRDGYRVYRLTYPSPMKTPHEANNMVPADYYLPDGIQPGDAKRPAVICLHILGGNFELVDITCSALAARGIPAIMFKLPYYGERGAKNGPRIMAANPALFVRAVDQGLQDVRRTIDVLCSRPEVDPQHIGITGISLGGIVSATAAGVEPRLSRAVFILAGGDVLTIINHARETRDLRQMLGKLPEQQRHEIEQRLSAVDPLTRAPGLRERAMAGRVLMINASRDEVIPPECTKKLAKALGIDGKTDQVVWLDGLGHYTAMAELPRAVRLTTDFFARDMPADARPNHTADSETPLQTTAQLLQQVATLLTVEPRAGRCHLADLKVTVMPNGQKPIEAELQIIRGWGYRFKLACDLPKVGQAVLGQGAMPWMLAADKRAFVGTAEPGTEATDPLAGADPAHLLKLRVVSGAAAALSLSPDVLLRWADIEDATTDGGPKTIRLVLKKKASGEVRLVFHEDGKTPASATFEIGDTQGTVIFRGWAIDSVAHRTMFQPPPDVPQQTVDTEELHRMFSAMFNFAMELTQ